MFRFKQFTIKQDRTPMKVGTDGVLLGAWVQVGPADRRILDIGTGTGLIALMLAQRTCGQPQVRITGVDAGDVAEARENADASPWGSRVEMVQCPVQRFDAGQHYDLIVSNPPFFVDSLTCPDAGRTRVRHAGELPFRDLHEAVVRLLAPDGRFALILPPAEAERFLSECRQLRVIRRTEVRSTPRRGVRRVLMELARCTAGRCEDTFVSHETVDRPGLADLPGRMLAGPLLSSSAGASILLPQSSAPVSFALSPALSRSSSSSADYVPGFDGLVDAEQGSLSFCATGSCASDVLSVIPTHPAASDNRLSSAVISADQPETDTLTISTGAHEEYTEEYRALTREFYLKF